MRSSRLVLFGIASLAVTATPIAGAYATCMMNVGALARPIVEQRQRIGFVKADSDEAICHGGGGGPIDVGGDDMGGDAMGGGDMGGPIGMGEVAESD